MSAAKVDAFVTELEKWIVEPNPTIPCTIMAQRPIAGDVRRVAIRVGGALFDAIYLPAIPVQLAPALAKRASTRQGSPWVVVATNYQSPVPPVPVPFTYYLVDDNGVPLVDEDGAFLVE